MIYTIRNTKNEKFQVEIPENSTVSDLKKLIFDLKSYPEAAQSIIFRGKVISNETALTSDVYPENSTFFCFVKNVPTPVSVPVSTNPSTVNTSALSSNVPNTASTSISTSTSSISTPVTNKSSPLSIPSTPVKNSMESDVVESTPTESNSNTLSGFRNTVQQPTSNGVSIPTVTLSEDEKNRIVDDLVGMGFPESESRYALEASNWNTTIATNMLLEGPEPSTSYTPYLSHSSMQSTEHSQQEVSSTPAVDVLSSSFDPKDMDYNTQFEAFKKSPSFITYKKILDEQPTGIETVLEDIKIKSPAFYKTIMEHEEAFLEFVNNTDVNDDDNNTLLTETLYNNLSYLHNIPVETLKTYEPSKIIEMYKRDVEMLQANQAAYADDDAMDESDEYIQQNNYSQSYNQKLQEDMTPEDVQAVSRLMELGFSREQCIEAYFVCDKDENAAANFLFSS